MNRCLPSMTSLLVYRFLLTQRDLFWSWEVFVLKLRKRECTRQFLRLQTRHQDLTCSCKKDLHDWNTCLNDSTGSGTNHNTLNPKFLLSIIALSVFLPWLYITSLISASIAITNKQMEEELKNQDHITQLCYSKNSSTESYQLCLFSEYHRTENIRFHITSLFFDQIPERKKKKEQNLGQNLWFQTRQQ